VKGEEMNIRQAIIPIGKTRKGKVLKSFAGVTIHNTGNHNTGADADANARYLRNNAFSNIAGFHYVVDKDEIVCTIPENEIAEHSGKRLGNDTTVSIEICDNSDGDILAATNNAAELAADILKRHGVKKAVHKENIFQHFDWSGKDCPAQIRRSNPYSWDKFLERVNFHLGIAEQPEEKPAAPTFHITKTLKYVKSNMMKDKDGEDNVTAIQRNLKSLEYYGGAVDGIFGPITKKAVEDFQEDYKLVSDGIVGQKTTETLGGVWDGK
jgi:N-acetylmuramoyl-L-alanine amidase CwlA